MGDREARRKDVRSLYGTVSVAIDGCTGCSYRIAMADNRKTVVSISLSLLLLVACSQPGGRSGALDAAQIVDAGTLDADSALDQDAGGPCNPNPTPLLVRDYSGSERYFVEVIHEDEPKALQLDTGSSLTFLFTGAGQPDHEPNIATIQIGCEEIWVDGRGYDANDPPIAGLPVVGLLGMDYLLEKPSLLDVEARLLTRHDSFPEELTTAPGTFSVAFDNVIGHALFPVTLDGSAIRLMFDTGGGNTLWVGVEGNPGDPIEYAEDFEGTLFPYYVGTGVLELVGQPGRTIPVNRAPVFPYFDLTVQALGGNLHGLLGVTAFPAEQLLFNGATSQMWVLPK